MGKGELARALPYFLLSRGLAPVDDQRRISGIVDAIMQVLLATGCAFGLWFA